MKKTYPPPKKKKKKTFLFPFVYGTIFTSYNPEINRSVADNVLHAFRFQHNDGDILLYAENWPTIMGGEAWIMKSPSSNLFLASEFYDDDYPTTSTAQKWREINFRTEDVIQTFDCGVDSLMCYYSWSPTVVT